MDERLDGNEIVKALVLGGAGMLGHQLFKVLGTSMAVRATLRKDISEYSEFGLFDSGNSYGRVEASPGHVEECIADFSPDVVVNCIGIVKQRPIALEAIPSIEVNSLFPHQVAEACRKQGARLIHLSTDCVFSGRRGMYSEVDVPDAQDLYGRSKLLGEVAEEGCLTVRTSIIGPELARKGSLLEWFLAQKGKSVNGFRRAIFSGFSTLEMSRIIERLILSFPRSSGLYHVSTAPISKYDLLMLLQSKMNLQVDVRPDDSFFCDRSLDSTLFGETFGYRPPSWDAMAEELASALGSAA